LVERNNVFIASAATSFGHYSHRPANAIQNLKTAGKHVVHKNVKLYGIPFTSFLNFVNFTILRLANVEAGELFGIFILALDSF
jgi:hypothetical protein